MLQRSDLKSGDTYFYWAIGVSWSWGYVKTWKEAWGKIKENIDFDIDISRQIHRVGASGRNITTVYFYPQGTSDEEIEKDSHSMTPIICERVWTEDGESSMHDDSDYNYMKANVFTRESLKNADKLLEKLSKMPFEERLKNMIENKKEIVIVPPGERGKEMKRFYEEAKDQYYHLLAKWMVGADDDKIDKL
jgi:hypothetical protein